MYESVSPWIASQTYRRYRRAFSIVEANESCSQQLLSSASSPGYAGIRWEACIEAKSRLLLPVTYDPCSGKDWTSVVLYGADRASRVRKLTFAGSCLSGTR